MAQNKKEQSSDSGSLEGTGDEAQVQNNNKSLDLAIDALRLGEQQKARLDFAIKAFSIFIGGMFALGIFTKVFELKPQKEIDDEHVAIANLIVGDFERRLVSFSQAITLSSTTPSQQRVFLTLRDEFHDAEELLRERPRHGDLERLIAAFEEIILNNSPGKALPTLMDLERSQTSSKIEALALVSLGVAHHMKKDLDEGREAYSKEAETYFARAAESTFKIGTAYNGLAVERLLRSFQQISAGSHGEVLKQIAEAETALRTAQETDGTIHSYYKYLNNTTYLSCKLLGYVLDGKLAKEDLWGHYYLSGFEEFLKKIQDGYKTAEQFAHGGTGAPQTTAQCMSICAEFYEKEGGSIARSKEGYTASRNRYIKAVERGLLEGRSPEAIRQRLDNDRLLRGMLRQGTNREMILRRAGVPD